MKIREKIRSIKNKERIKTSKTPNFIASFNYAIDGIVYAFKNEINFRVHILSAIMVALISLFFDLSRVEMAILSITIAMVIMAELINTAIEATVDLLTQQYHQYAKIAKDVAAGAVLVMALTALFIGYLIFFDRLIPLSQTVALKLQQSTSHMAFLAMVLVVLLTIILKSKFYHGHGTHVYGGSVSGHAAVAFCASTIISLLTVRAIIVVLSYGVALLVAESRIEGRIHSLKEVVSGAMLGILVAMLLFRGLLLL